MTLLRKLVVSLFALVAGELKFAGDLIQGIFMAASTLLRQSLRRRILCPLSILLCFTAQGSNAPNQPISFNRDIRPILSDKCFYCHGPDVGHRKGKLRLDIREEAVKKEAFVPGKPKESELVRRIFESNPDDEAVPFAPG